MRIGQVSSRVHFANGTPVISPASNQIAGLEVISMINIMGSSENILGKTAEGRKEDIATFPSWWYLDISQKGGVKKQGRSGVFGVC